MRRRRLFVLEQEGNLGRWRFQTPPHYRALTRGSRSMSLGAHSWPLPFALLPLLRVSAQMLCTPSPSIACCARRAVSLHFKRNINIKTPTLITDEGTQPLTRPKVTKKKYAELPTGRVLPDGTLSPPLSQWTGGLREPVGMYENCISSIRAHIHADQYTSFLTILPLVGCAMLTEEAHSPAPDQLSHDIEPRDSPTRQESDLIPAKKTRRRRVKLSIAETASTPEDAEESLSATPKRRKRKTSKQTLDGRYQ